MSTTTHHDEPTNQPLPVECGGDATRYDGITMEGVSRIATIGEFNTLASPQRITRVEAHDPLWQPQLRAELNALHPHGHHAQVQVRIPVPPSPAQLRRELAHNPEGIDLAQLQWECQWLPTYHDALEAATARWNVLHGTLDPTTQTIMPPTDPPKPHLVYTYSYDSRDPEQVARYQRWEATVYPELVERLPSADILHWGHPHDLHGPEPAPTVRSAEVRPGVVSPAWDAAKRIARPTHPGSPPLDRETWEITDGVVDIAGSGPKILPNQKPRAPEDVEQGPSVPRDYMGTTDPETGDARAAYHLHGQGYTWQAMRAPLGPGLKQTVWFLAKGHPGDPQIVTESRTSQPRVAATFQDIVQRAHDAGASVEVVRASKTAVQRFQTAAKPFLKALTGISQQASDPWVVLPLGAKSAVVAQYHASTGHLTPVLRQKDETPSPWVLPQAMVSASGSPGRPTLFSGWCHSIGLDAALVQSYLEQAPPPDLIRAVQRMVRDPEWPQDPSIGFPDAWQSLTAPAAAPDQPWWILPGGDDQHWQAIQPHGMDPAHHTLRWTQWHNPHHHGQTLYTSRTVLEGDIHTTLPQATTVMTDGHHLPAAWQRALAPILSYQFNALDDPEDARWRLIRPTRAEKWLAVRPGRLRKDGSIPLTAQMAPQSDVPRVFTAQDVQAALAHDPTHYHPTVLSEPEAIPVRWHGSVKQLLQAPPDFQRDVYRWVRSEPGADTWLAVTRSARDTGHPDSPRRLEVLRNGDDLRTPRLFPTAVAMPSDPAAAFGKHFTWHPRPVQTSREVHPEWRASLDHLALEIPTNSAWRWVAVGSQGALHLRHPDGPSHTHTRETLTHHAKRHMTAAHHERSRHHHRPVHLGTLQTWIAVRPAEDGHRLELRRMDQESAKNPKVRGMILDDGAPIWTQRRAPEQALAVSAQSVPTAWAETVQTVQHTLRWSDPSDPRWRLVPIADGHQYIAVRPDAHGKFQTLADPQSQQAVRFRPEDCEPSALARFARQHHLVWHPTAKTPDGPIPAAWQTHLDRQRKGLAASRVRHPEVHVPIV